MGREFELGEFEQMVLLVVMRLGEEAYGPAIAQYLERRVERPVSRGALYSTLGRLEEKGFLGWRLEEPDAHRGGHRKRRFALSPAGIEALRTYRVTLMQLWSGLEFELGEAEGV